MLAARDEMLTMTPPPAVSTIAGTANRVSRKAEVTLKRKACSKARSLVRSSGCGGQPPALLTTMSIRPNSATVAATRCSSWARSVTSVGTARARRPVARTALGGRLDLVDRAGRAHHVGADLGQRGGDAGADAAAGAGDDGYLVGHLEQVEDHRFPLGSSRPPIDRWAGNRTQRGGDA